MKRRREIELLDSRLTRLEPERPEEDWPLDADELEIIVKFAISDLAHSGLDTSPEGLEAVARARALLAQVGTSEDFAEIPKLRHACLVDRLIERRAAQRPVIMAMGERILNNATLPAAEDVRAAVSAALCWRWEDEYGDPEPGRLADLIVGTFGSDHHLATWKPAREAFNLLSSEAAKRAKSLREAWKASGE